MDKHGSRYGVSLIALLMLIGHPVWAQEEGAADDEVEEEVEEEIPAARKQVKPILTLIGKSAPVVQPTFQRLGETAMRVRNQLNVVPDHALKPDVRSAAHRFIDGMEGVAKVGNGLGGIESRHEKIVAVIEKFKPLVANYLAMNNLEVDVATLRQFMKDLDGVESDEALKTLVAQTEGKLLGHEMALAALKGEEGVEPTLKAKKAAYLKAANSKIVDLSETIQEEFGMIGFAMLAAGSKIGKELHQRFGYESQPGKTAKEQYFDVKSTLQKWNKLTRNLDPKTNTSLHQGVESAVEYLAAAIAFVPDSAPPPPVVAQGEEPKADEPAAEGGGN